jgi:hypothetical protein
MYVWIEIQYWFPNNGDPNSSNSVFNSQPEFIDPLLKNKAPTLNSIQGTTAQILD